MNANGNKNSKQDSFICLPIGFVFKQLLPHKNIPLDEVYMETNALSCYIDMLECGKRFNMELLRQLAYF